MIWIGLGFDEVRQFAVLQLANRGVLAFQVRDEDVDELALGRGAAAQPHATISYDPNVRPSIVPDREFARARAEEVVRLSDVVHASDEDIAWLYPDRPLTKKPAETRMGSGKGSPEWWIANVKPGRVLFEISGVSEDVAREALRLAIHKLPMKARIVRREGGE